MLGWLRRCAIGMRCGRLDGLGVDRRADIFAIHYRVTIGSSGVLGVGLGLFVILTADDFVQSWAFGFGLIVGTRWRRGILQGSLGRW